MELSKYKIDDIRALSGDARREVTAEIRKAISMNRVKAAAEVGGSKAELNALRKRLAMFLTVQNERPKAKKSKK